jgi:hypothetical protein
MVVDSTGGSTVYEHPRHQLLPLAAFLRRVARSALAFALVVALSLAIGTFGYHWFARLRWIDAFLNAAMILTGMGPVSPLPTDGAKLFAAVYALFSGIVFLAGVGVLIAPLLHRLLHRFHLEENEAPDRPTKST